MKYGEIVTAKVIDQNDSHYFVQFEGESFAVNKESLNNGQLQLGDEVEGMIYENMNRRKVMQVDLGDIRPGYFGWGKVTDSRRDLGIFVDIGLEEKDVVVSMDELPLNTKIWPKKNDKVYLTWDVDQKNRLWGHIASIEEMEKLHRPVTHKVMNQTIDATIYEMKLEGAVGISVEGYRVFIHNSEQTSPLRIGQTVRGRVIDTHKDNSINVSLKPRAHEMIDDDAQMLLAILNKQADNFLPLHDKSDPQVIQTELGISKGQFKRAVGQLLKERLIKQEKGKGIWLIESSDKDE